MEALISAFKEYFVTPEAVLVLVGLLVTWLSGYWNRWVSADGPIARFAPAFLSVVLVAIGCVADLGFFAGMDTQGCIAYAVGIALASMGWFSFDWIKVLLGKLGATQPSVQALMIKRSRE